MSDLDLKREARNVEPLEEGGVAQQPSPSSLRSPLGLILMIGGIGGALLVCGCGPLLVLMPSLTGESSLTGPVIQQAIALMVLGVGFGIASVIVGRGMWKEQPSASFHPQRIGLLWGGFFLLLLLGGAVSALDLAPTYLLPPLNTLMMTLLPVLVLGMVGRAMRGRVGTWRDVLGGLIGGASIGTGLAMVIELSVAATLVVGALALGLVPGGAEGLESLAERLNDPTLMEDPQALLDLFSPALVLAVLIFVSTLIPLVEEITKTLGVGLAGLWLRPSPARAFLLGVASGAGFALAENLLNGAVISAVWGVGIISRFAATLMHCATGGLMGWGWGGLWTQKRPLRLILAFLGAVGLHGVWNGLAVGIAAGGVTASGQMDDLVRMTALGLVVLLMLAVLAALAVGSLVGLLWAARALARQRKESIDSL